MIDLNDRESIREFIKQNNIKDFIQLNDLFKKMMGAIIEEMLEAERDEYLGYQRYQRSENTNSRNGYSSKMVRSSQGDIQIDIPRDREGQFQPELIKKYQRDISQIEDKIISLYAKGMTIRDIQSHLQEIYGAEISLQTISNITDRILPFLNEWRSRPLKEIYAIVYIDGQRFKVRSEGTVKDKVVYTVLGIDINGNKDILGLWISETETSRYWLSVLTEIRNRGVKDILVITSDDLVGIEESIRAIYPETIYQGCVVHLIRNSQKYVSYKDIKEFSNDMKSIYKAATEELAKKCLEEFSAKWDKRYPLAVRVWTNGWDRISAMFRFTGEVRRLIYTTNPIESVHREFRKVTKGKSHFPDDMSLLKMLYLSGQELMRGWTMKVQNWNRILSELSIHFGERVSKYL